MGSASAGTQQIGPFTVSDQVTQDTTANTTTATYTITRNDNKHQSNQVDVGFCATNQISSISHNGKVWQNDPSTKVSGPVIRWPANNVSDPGHVFVYSYTVQGLYDAADQPLAIKSGSNTSTGTVQGIGCNPSGQGGQTSTTTTTSNPNNAAPGSTPAGQLQVLGERGPACQDNRKFSWKLHKFRKARITDVTVFVNNKRTAHKSGHNIKSIAIGRLPQSNFTITIVSKQSTGSSITSKRKYTGCTKGRPKVRSHHAHPHHR